MPVVAASPGGLAKPVVLDLRPILAVVGILLVILALFMAPPMVADMAAGHPDWQVFLVAGSVTLFIGVSLMLMNRTPGFGELNGRQVFLLTTTVWIGGRRSSPPCRWCSRSSTSASPMRCSRRCRASPRPARR